MSDPRCRCSWVSDDPLYIDYHDKEWGRPEYRPNALFECLILEGAQAGLSWITILRKREGYRAAFAGFDPERIARFGEAEIASLLGNPGIVRHRGKIEACIGNARAWLALRERGVDPVAWLWSFADNLQRHPQRAASADVPASSPESELMSRALKKAGFRFVGSTTCYAFMQAVGMVNDHQLACFRQTEIAESPFQRQPK